MGELRRAAVIASQRGSLVCLCERDGKSDGRQTDPSPHSQRTRSLCYNGFWFAPEMELIKAAIDHTQKHCAGAVELSLYKGNVTVLGRESPYSLYSADLASMDIEGGGSAFDYDPLDAQGFIRINAVRLRAYNHLQRQFDK